MSEPRIRTRVLAVVGLLAGAPVTAEFLQAYLSDTGSALALIGGIVFFAPLYGGAALIIREVAVRLGLGWTGRLLLAGVFGVAMPTLIDLSAFTPHRSDVADWAAQWAPTAVGGISWGATTVWALGHVVFSIAVPLALLDALAPAVRGRPLVARAVLGVVGVAFLAVAAFVRVDGSDTAVVSVVQTVCAAAVVVVLALLALRARPVRARADRPTMPVWVAALVGAVVLSALDLAPFGWAGLALVLGVVLAAAVLVRWSSASPRWTVLHITALAVTALLGRTLLGFVSPLPPGVALAPKLIQSSVLAVVVLVVSALALVRARRSRYLGSAAADGPAISPVGRAC